MDGMTYAPRSAVQTERVVGPGECIVGVIGLDHGHIYAMATGLIEAGAEIKVVYDPDPAKVQEFCTRFPTVRVASSKEEILADPTIMIVASAIIPAQRSRLGLEVMESGKHYFCDKPGMLSLDDVEAVRRMVKKSGKRYFVYFGERIHVEGALYVQRLIEEGHLGKIVSVTILAPHRLNKPSRPAWFFDPEQNGGIIADIGSHQLEQFLTYTGSTDATVLHSSIANYHNGDHPSFSDFGQCLLVGDSGATGYFRVDWFTPEGLGAWGDGRVFVVGTKATAEIRKYLDVATSNEGDQVFLVDSEGEHRIKAHATIGFPFFAQMISDCINGTEEAIGQEHTLRAMALAIEAQEKARCLTP